MTQSKHYKYKTNLFSIHAYSPVHTLINRNISNFISFICETFPSMPPQNYYDHSRVLDDFFELGLVETMDASGFLAYYLIELFYNVFILLFSPILTNNEHHVSIN